MLLVIFMHVDTLPALHIRLYTEWMNNHGVIVCTEVLR